MTDDDAGFYAWADALDRETERTWDAIEDLRLSGAIAPQPPAAAREEDAA